MSKGDDETFKKNQVEHLENITTEIKHSVDGLNSILDKSEERQCTRLKMYQAPILWPPDVKS